MNVLGIHHVTAVSAKIAENCRFYTALLGLRLVKKSVNQDDVSAYHLFYADAVGTPGTDMTFFDWPTIGLNRPGLATISRTTMRVSGSSLAAWEGRFREHGVAFERDEDGAGRARLVFTDPEGQSLAFVDDADVPGEAVQWTGAVPAELSTRGILGVDLTSARPDSTRRVLTELLGYQDLDRTRFQVTTPNSVSEINVVESTSRTFGSVGAGGVHHVAFRVKDDEELRAFQDRIESAGLATSGYVDRYYFHSLYFREPGGILFELATDGPGMAVDQSPEELGTKLSLPPFLENRRASIEANLKPL